MVKTQIDLHMNTKKKNDKNHLVFFDRNEFGKIMVPYPTDTKFVLFFLISKFLPIIFNLTTILFKWHIDHYQICCITQTYVEISKGFKNIYH